MAERRYAPEKLMGRILEYAKAPAQLRGARLPEWFDVRLWHPDWPKTHARSQDLVIEMAVSVDPETGPVLAGLRSERGSTLTYQDAGDLLRATCDIDELLGFWTEEAVGLWAKRQFAAAVVGDVPEGTPLSELDPAAVRQLVTLGDNAVAGVRGTMRPSRRRIITPGLLKEVADVYRAALNAGRPPTIEVAEHFMVSHRTATRWVGEARKGGHLGAAVGPKAGEATDDAMPSE